MKTIKIDLPRSLECVEIELFSDLHIGDKHCNIRLIQDRISRVKNNPNTYAILLGDIIDNATKTSVGDTYEETLSPMEQMKTAISMFEPIKDKIIGGVSGNHCARSYKTDGIDLMYFLFAELGQYNRYDPNGALLFIRLGEYLAGRKESNGSGKPRQILYTLYLTHGATSGRTIGAKANGLQRMGQVVNADICCIGHTHSPMVFREKSYEINYCNNTILEKETIFVNASSTLEWGGYAERLSLKPSSLKSPVIRLGGAKKEIDVTL